MNGKGWRISVIVAMLEYGEREAGGSDVVHVANLIFPNANAWYGAAQFELDEYRKHLMFLRDAPDPPSLEKQLSWALSSGVRKRHLIAKDFRMFLNSHSVRSDVLRRMADLVRQPAAA